MIIVHSTAPYVSGSVEDCIVDVRPWSRNGPFVKLRDLGIEHSDLIAAKLCEPQAVIRVHVSTARAGVGSWCRVRSDLACLPILLDDVCAVEVQAVKIILRIGRYAISAQA